MNHTKKIQESIYIFSFCTAFSFSPSSRLSFSSYFLILLEIEKQKPSSPERDYRGTAQHGTAIATQQVEKDGENLICLSIGLLYFTPQFNVRRNDLEQGDRAKVTGIHFFFQPIRQNNTKRNLNQNQIRKNITYQLIN